MQKTTLNCFSINIRIIFYIFIANGPSYITLNSYHLKFDMISIFIKEKKHRSIFGSFALYVFRIYIQIICDKGLIKLHLTV